MWIRTITAGACVSVISLAACAQGSYDFDDIPGVDVNPTVAINMGPTQIGFLRSMFGEIDPATADMLSGLRGVQLRVYHDPENQRQRQFNSFIENVTEDLEDAGWMRVMYVQDEGKNARIHMQMTEEEVTGMTVMLFDGSEAAFINIDGTISAADLGRIMAVMGAGDVLGGMPPFPGFAVPSAVPAQPVPEE